MMDDVERMEQAVVEHAQEAAVAAARGVLEAAGLEPRGVIVVITKRRRLTLILARGSR